MCVSWQFSLAKIKRYNAKTYLKRHFFFQTAKYSHLFTAEQLRVIVNVRLGLENKRKTFFLLWSILKEKIYLRQLFDKPAVIREFPFKCYLNIYWNMSAAGNTNPSRVLIVWANQTCGATCCVNGAAKSSFFISNMWSHFSTPSYLTAAEEESTGGSVME